MKVSTPEWANLLKAALHEPLPGEAAHEELRAIPISEQKFNFKHDGPPRPGSVLILLCGNPGQLWFPLIKRTDTGGVHSGQISLPGGRTEEGESMVSTALREAQEEIGIDPASIEIIGKLTPMHVIPSNYLVTPVIGRWTKDYSPDFLPERNEVDHIIKSTLQELINQYAIRKADIRVRGYQISAPHFWIGNQMVWGATAMMLNEFRQILISKKIS